jgi:DNA-binding TFAR19-related protein (PDSD5 family)
MQNPLTDVSHGWLGYILAAIIGLVGGKGPDWYSAWQNRKKPDADIDLTGAQAELARAQARKEDKETVADIMDLLENAALKSAAARERLEVAEAAEAKLKELVAIVRLRKYMDENELKKYTE